MPEAIKEGFIGLEKAYNEKTVDGVSGLDTGLLDVNAHTSGLHPGELVILAARPAMGKTALALQIAMNLALHPSESRRAPVAVFSLEMSTAKLAQRMMSMHGRVDASRMRSGRMTEDDWNRIVKHAGKLSEAEIYIDDTAGIGLFDMKAKIRQLALEKGIKLVVIDYLQLVRTPHLSSRTNREQQIAEVSRELKAIAKDFGVCVLALAQLNRGVESRADKRPMNSDLRESGQIEQDADVITFLYRDEVYNDASEHKGVAELIFGNHRNGDIGTVRLKWQKTGTRFDNLLVDGCAHASQAEDDVGATWD
jgi:replicative DNA helicase